jgi:hypothetical protein
MERNMEERRLHWRQLSMDSEYFEWELVQPVAIVDTHCRWVDFGKSTAWVTIAVPKDNIYLTLTVFPSVPMYCMAGFSFGCDMLMPNWSQSCVLPQVAAHVYIETPGLCSSYPGPMVHIRGSETLPRCQVSRREKRLTQSSAAAFFSLMVRLLSLAVEVAKSGRCAMIALVYSYAAHRPRR